MDEELRTKLRAADAGRDKSKYERVVAQAPADWLAAEKESLTRDIEWLQDKLNLINVNAPLCPCGKIGEPFCAEHKNVLTELEEAKAEYEKAKSPLRKEMAGVILAQAYVDAGFPGHEAGRCSFPGCTNFANGYCYGHAFVSQSQHFRSRASQARKRS